MRFFEFAVDNSGIVDYRIKSTKDWYRENQPLQVRENQQSEENLQEIKQFLATHRTDPKDLTVGEHVYPIYILAHPSSGSMTVEIADAPVEYMGTNDDDYVFKGTRLFRIPIQAEHVEDYGTMIYATTVYSSVEGCQQFITLMNYKFHGRWAMKQKRLTV